MARGRKRVHALLRAPDGSAFQKCDACGVSVVVALADMHECNNKKFVKRFRGQCEPLIIKRQSFQDQPRSAFSFFMERFLNMKDRKGECLIDIDREGWGKWKNMSKQEQKPYILQADKVNSEYLLTLSQEAKDMLLMSREDDEADSAMAGKFDKDCRDDEFSDYSGSFKSSWLQQYESLYSQDYWRMMCPWLLKDHSSIFLPSC